MTMKTGELHDINSAETSHNNSWNKQRYACPQHFLHIWYYAFLQTFRPMPISQPIHTSSDWIFPALYIVHACGLTWSQICYREACMTASSFRYSILMTQGRLQLSIHLVNRRRKLQPCMQRRVYVKSRWDYSGDAWRLCRATSCNLNFINTTSAVRRQVAAVSACHLLSVPQRRYVSMMATAAIMRVKRRALSD